MVFLWGFAWDNISLPSDSKSGLIFDIFLNVCQVFQRHFLEDGVCDHWPDKADTEHFSGEFKSYVYCIS